MKRSLFIKQVATLATLGIPILSLSTACNNDDDPPPPPPPGDDKDCLANGTVSSIGSNHGHTLVVSKADVDAEVEKTYGIQGGATHAHDVTITAAMFTMLKANNSVTATSSEGSSHSHSVTVSCA